MNRLSDTNGSTNALNLICYHKIVRFDQINGNYDDSNKLKPKNPQTHPYFDRLSERRAIREGSDESAKIADLGEEDYNV